MSEKCSRKVAENASPHGTATTIFGITFHQKSIKKIDANIDVEQVIKIHEKSSQTGIQIDVKINEKSMRFWNLRFLVFAESITLKSFFYMIRGADNHQQIYQKSMRKQA